jgi:hypothetical protein
VLARVRVRAIATVPRSWHVGCPCRFMAIGWILPVLAACTAEVGWTGTLDGGTPPALDGAPARDDTGAVALLPDAGSSSDAGATADAGEITPMCSIATTPCAETTECCGALTCDTTSLGRVCCGNTGESCATAGGEDCCGSLLCITGRCGLPERACASPCFAPPALVVERDRLAAIGGSFLGICGDAAHTYGFHVPAARLPASDYSLRGELNDPVCAWHAAAIDIGMDWPASRDWLRWLIMGIRDDTITGIAEVIGSYDGVNVRYWSDTSGWHLEGDAYPGSGHDTWSHVSIYRSTALEDHGILAGWTADGRL